MSGSRYFDAQKAFEYECRDGKKTLLHCTYLGEAIPLGQQKNVSTQIFLLYWAEILKKFQIRGQRVGCFTRGGHTTRVVSSPLAHFVILPQ